jgi:hypothetical protein
MEVLWGGLFLGLGTCRRGRYPDLTSLPSWGMEDLAVCGRETLRSSAPSGCSIPGDLLFFLPNLLNLGCVIFSGQFKAPSEDEQ